MRSVVRSLVIACCVAASAAAQPKIEDLAPFYGASTAGEAAEYDLKITTDGESHTFWVKYSIADVGPFTANVETLRVLTIDGKQTNNGKGHVLVTKYKRDKGTIKNLADQLKANKTSEEWTNLNVTKLEATGTEKLTVNGAELECVKIAFEYSGQVGKIPVTAKEVIYYNATIPVMKTAKLVGEYELSTINGVKKQTVELVCIK